VDKAMLNVELKPGDAMDCSRWKASIKWYWCDSNYWGWSKGFVSGV